MTPSRLARTLLTAVLAGAALVTAGCGNRHDVVTQAETEGIWVDAGPLDYHVQGSRVMESGVLPDRSYLSGLPNGTSTPAGDEVWFAVFMRIENKTDAAATTSKAVRAREYRPAQAAPPARRRGRSEVDGGCARARDAVPRRTAGWSSNTVPPGHA